MIIVRVLDEKGNRLELDELNDIGLGEVIYHCKELIEEAEDLHRQIQDDDNDEDELAEFEQVA